MLQFLVSILEFCLSRLYKDRFYPRFYVLETVSRVPYFAFLSVLHLYESLGLWHQADWIKIHFAESWNELHHLRIVEALGGGEYWLDRLFAHIGVFAYYWILVLPEERRPKIENLYDVFVEIRNDEMAHIHTMIACQRPDAKEQLKSPHSRDTLKKADC
ncbi:hypothetical protein Cri9333_2513 [Crinalium epipsammum PCC 9333]|uniref:Plastoquinol terminal oxidase n=1 Tax=Crinalium epipsammum PCC 9333 TaxID=1173022 RepID=K9W0Q9_9CYAN|nr:alternative oxidase [Crinalium epipsammum]AFZ13379.1 hypothetical protein Cri9333_2513 [Crinalium epipsammum PCC 9333]